MTKRSKSEWIEIINKFNNRNCSASEFARIYKVSTGAIYEKRKLLKLVGEAERSNDSAFIPISINSESKKNSILHHRHHE